MTSPITCSITSSITGPKRKFIALFRAILLCLVVYFASNILTLSKRFFYFRSSVRNERDLRWREYDVDENDEKARLIEEGEFGLLNQLYRRRR